MHTLSRSLRALAVTAALLIAMALAAGCGGQTAGDQAAPSASASASTAALPTGEEILTKAMEADEQVEQVSASYKISVAVTADPAAAEQLQDELGPLAQGPVEVSGVVNAAEKPMLADMTMDLAVADGSMSMKMGLRVKEAEGWLQFMGQWYELPPELETSLKEASAGDAQEPQWAEFEKLLTELGIEPQRWARELTVVGEESLEGVTVYHLRIVPNLKVLATDMVTVLKSEQFAKLLGGQVSAKDLQQMQGISDADLKEMQATIEDVVQNPVVELWVRADTYLIAKMVASGTLEMPEADVEAEGIQSIAADLTVSMREPATPVTVQAPPSPRPYTELEKVFGGESGGLFGGASLDGSTQ